MRLPALALVAVAVTACGRGEAPPAPQEPAPNATGLDGVDDRAGDPPWFVPASARVAGRVLDADGRAVERFSLRVLASRGGPFDVCVATQEFASAPGGAFELDGLPAELLRIEARATGFAPVLSARLATRADRVESGIELRLSRGGALRGRVLDAASGAPIAGARISVEAEHEWFDLDDAFASASTADDGTFHVENLIASCHRVFVTGEGRAPACVESVQVIEGRESAISFELVVGARLTGSLRGPDGAPLPGARVQLSPADLNEIHGSRSARTDAAGRFRIDHIAPGAYSASATRPDESGDPFVALADMKRSEISLDLVDGETREVELSLADPRAGARRARAGR